MARTSKSTPVNAEDLQGFEYFGAIRALLKRLHTVGTARDKAGNRKLFYDDYVCLLLLYFFNATITSMRGLQKASELEKVRKALGIKRTSFGSLNEASTVFDPAPLREIVQELAAQAKAQKRSASKPNADASSALAGLEGLIAVDGTFLHTLPRMTWALWRKHHRAAKMHLHFDVFNYVPCDATVTAGAKRETEQLRLALQPDRLYVMDRGYISYRLYRSILDAGASFIARVKERTVFTVLEERELSPKAREAGVTRDVLVSRLGTLKHTNHVKQPLRVVKVEATSPDGKPYTVSLATDRLDMPADLVAQAYRYRWSIELFFRWFKCVMGCRHPIAESENGLTIQCYVGLIASLIVSLWTGQRPTKRTWEMLQHYFSGWASLDELERHLEQERAKKTQLILLAAGRARA